MKLWVGLGNPGEKYANHRHNVGFMAIDAIADAYNFGPEKVRFQGITREGQITVDGRSVKIVLLKPTTFMNESGRSVQKAMQFYKLSLNQLVVFHDELDLAPGKFRLKTGGGIAGHNGLRSIRQQLGDAFHRARLGIGHPGHKDKVHTYVLSNFAKSEQDWLETYLDALARSADYLAADEFEKYQSRISLLAPAPSR